MPAVILLLIGFLLLTRCPPADHCAPANRCPPADRYSPADRFPPADRCPPTDCSPPADLIVPRGDGEQWALLTGAACARGPCSTPTPAELDTLAGLRFGQLGGGA